MERESYLERCKRRLAEGQERLEKIKGIAGEYNTLMSAGSDLIDRAKDIYMEGDRIEDWEEFEKCMRASVSNFKAAMELLHRLAEVTPSDVPPERYVVISNIISRVNDTLLTYHQHWGKRLVQEEHDRIMTTDIWTCVRLLVEGVKHGDMESPSGEAYCHNKCKYKDTCDHAGL